MDGLESNAKKLGDTLKTAFTIGAVVAFGNQIKNTVDELVRAYSVQEQAERRLAAAVANNPYLDERNARSLQRFASSLQEVTTVGDETTLTMASMLASFGRTQTEIEQVITAAVDLSAATGMTLDSAVRNLNKTFGGLSGELGELIPELKDLTTEQLKAGDGVDLVARQFDGLAQSMEGTVDFIDRQFDNAWGDLQEALGQRFAEAAKPAKMFFTELITDMTNTITRIDDLKLAFADLANVMNQSAQQQTYGFAAMTEDQLESVMGDARSIISEGLLALFDETGAAENFARAGQGNLWDRVKGALGVGANIATGNFGNTQLVQALNEVLGPQATREDLENLSTNQLIDVIQALPDDISKSIDMTALKDAAGLLDRAIRVSTTRGRIPVQPSRVSDLLAQPSGGGEGGGAGDEIVKDVGKRLASLLDKGGVGEKSAKLGDVFESFSSEVSAVDLQFGTLYMGANQLADVIDHKLIVNMDEAAAALFDLGDTVREVTEAQRDHEDAYSTGGLGYRATASGFNRDQSFNLDGITEAFAGGSPLLVGFQQLAQHFDSLVALMDPVNVLLTGIADALGPLVNDTFTAFVGMLLKMGETVGQMLMPALSTLMPFLDAWAKAWTFLYNNVFVPVYNALRTMWNAIYNGFAGFINGLIYLINLIPGVNIQSVAYRDLDFGHLDKIEEGGLGAAGADYLGGGGGNANYTTGRNITVNIDLVTDAIVGEDGMREFAVMIRDEIRAAEALGY